MGLDRFRKSYDSMVKKTMKKNKYKLVDSFIEYYGEEYSDIIKNRFNDICFFYYIDWDTIKKLIRYGLKRDRLIVIDELINAYHDYRKIKPTENMKNVFIGITDNKVLYIPEFQNIIVKSIEQKNPCCINCSVGNQNKTMVGFQILTFDDKSLVHEINHAVTTDDISYIEKDGKDIAMIGKIGLNTYTTGLESKEEIIEELINEKTSEEIEDIFHKKGGNLSPICLNLGIKHVYTNNLYLIEDFYNEFKEYIKKARISNNKNLLVNLVGKDNYNEYINLVNMCFKSSTDSISEYERLITKQRISIIIYKMKKHALIEKDLKNNEIKNINNFISNNKVKILNK